MSGLLIPVAGARISRGFVPNSLAADQNSEAMATNGQKARVYDLSRGLGQWAGSTRYPSFHAAIDFAAPEGTPLVAMEAGTVIEPRPVGEGTWGIGGGNFVRVAINNHAQYAIAHLLRFAPGIYAGAKVKRGQLLGWVGQTGNATGPHAHVFLSLGPNVYYSPDRYFWDPRLFLVGGEMASDPRILPPTALPNTSITPGDDMHLSGSFLDHVINSRTTFTVDTHFREGSSRQDDSLQVLAAGVVFIPIVKVGGEKVGALPDAGVWYGGWLYLDRGGWTFGYAHSSCLKRTDDGKGVAFDAIQSTGAGYSQEQLDAAKAAAQKAGAAAGADAVLEAAKKAAAPLGAS